MRYLEVDRLVDSAGRLFRLVYEAEGGRTGLVASAEVLPLAAFAQHLQAHLFALAQCCVGKAALPDYAAGMATPAQLAQ